GDRQAVAAIAHGDLGHEPEMAGDELVRRVAIVMLAPTLGEHVFLLRFKHGELADLGEVAREAGFSVENRQGSCAGHIAPSTSVQAPDSGGRRSGTAFSAHTLSAACAV